VEKKRYPQNGQKVFIVLLHKGGDTEDTKNYRRISLLCTAYKIYAEVMRKRMEKIMEEKKMIPESQAGFRKGRSTIDNIFALNHLIQRERMRSKEEDRKIYALFVDLKAAFDKVDRKYGK